MNDTITHKGITYARSNLTKEEIQTMENYNSTQGNVSAKGSGDYDFEFRLNQARQMFGDEDTILSIEKSKQLK